MPIKNPFKKPTFKEKRESFGVSRSKETGKMNRTIVNPEERKVVNKNNIKRQEFEKKIFSLMDYKPKNETEARRKMEDLPRLKAELLKLSSDSAKKVETIKKIRETQRKNRQGRIVYEKLFNLLSSEDKTFFKKYYLKGNNFLDENKVLENYRNFLKKTNKNYLKITSNEAMEILKNSIYKI